MKYIDADKLNAEIKRLDKENKESLKSGGSIGRDFLFGIGAGYADVIKIIDSIQQEPRFPQYDNIVEKVFGAGNLEGWERDEAEMLVALAKEELLKSLQQEQPSLPSNLDEAAKEYACTKSPYGYNAFKAGAEWMAGQGYTQEGIAHLDDHEVWVDIKNTDIKDGDKIIVQIRKKE